MKWISYKSWRNGKDSAYHTDPNCHHVGPNHRPVSDDHDHVQELEECEYCSGDVDLSGEISQRSCPYCGKPVKRYSDHFPCDAEAKIRESDRQMNIRGTPTSDS